MGFRTTAYATIWTVEEGRGNTLKVRLSISKKNKDTGEYETDFSGFCTFIGNAKAKAEKLKPKDRIKLGDVDVTSWYNKDKGVEYITYKVFDFEMSDASSGNTSKPTSKPPKPSSKKSVLDGDAEEDDLPF